MMPTLAGPAQVVVVTDATGRPFEVNRARPMVQGRALTPESVAALPPGTTLRQCMLTRGQYDLADFTIQNCQATPDAQVHLRGNSVIEHCKILGKVTLAGESVSSGNAYLNAVVFEDSAQSTGDHFRIGYQSRSNQVVISHVSSTGAHDPFISERSRRRGRLWREMREGGRRAGRNALMAFTSALLPSTLGRPIMRGRRRYRGGRRW